MLKETQETLYEMQEKLKETQGKLKNTQEKLYDREVKAASDIASRPSNRGSIYTESSNQILVANRSIKIRILRSPHTNSPKLSIRFRLKGTWID